MKRSTLTVVACSLLLAAGCAHKEKHANYESRTSAPTYSGTSTTYNYNQSTDTTTTRTPETTTSQYSTPQTSTTINNNQSTLQTQIEPTASDTALISQVRAALNNDTTLVAVAPAIQVTAQSGTVTLSGNVSNDQQKQAIEHIVKGTSGVVTVNNQLQISSSPSPTGQQSGQSSLYFNSQKANESSTSATQPSTTTQPSSTSSTEFKSSTTEPSSTTTTPQSTSSEFKSSTTDTNQSSTTTPPDQSSLKKDELKNETSAAGGTGEASLSSTNTGSVSGQASVSDQATTPGTSTDTSTSATTSTDKSVSTTPSTQSATENKDLSATSERPSSRIYSTNTTDSTSSGSDTFNLSVRGSTDADQKLADQIKQELGADTSLAGAMSGLRIMIDNGKATLRGSVKTEEEKQKIEKSIQKVTGVTSVENQLRVGADAGQTDSSSNK
jgi:osmotically-inducible protein OsmY